MVPNPAVAAYKTFGTNPAVTGVGTGQPKVVEVQGSGEFGRGGGCRVRARLRLEGDFGDDYADFLKDKAARLSLNLQLEAGGTVVTASVSGFEALIGAFEMSAIIGTQGAYVDRWTWLSWDAE